MNKTMSLVTCPPLSAPTIGIVSCSLGNDGAPVPGSSCIFTCDGDYKLVSEAQRICKSDGSWSGNETKCKRGILSVTVMLDTVIFDSN